MNRMWKFVPVAGVLLAVLIIASGCLAPTSTPGTTQDTGTSTWYMIGFLVLIFALFYFVMIRPQRNRQKKQQQMMHSLQKGDEVVTAGGIFGRIDSLTEESVVIKTESGALLRVMRGSVAIRQQRQ
jgi:preprotein translocase subunit YajC